MIKTLISSAHQDKIEQNKPRFRFWFPDQPQYAERDRRGHFAHMLKSYRAQRLLYSVKKISLHTYEITLRNADIKAIISAE